MNKIEDETIWINICKIYLTLNPSDIHKSPFEIWFAKAIFKFQSNYTQFEKAEVMKCFVMNVTCYL